MDAITCVPDPRNEPVLDYAPGSAERAALERRLAERPANVRFFLRSLASKS